MSYQKVKFPFAHPLDNRHINDVLEVARASGAQVYLVGGYIRDLLSGRMFRDGAGRKHDLDFAVAGVSALDLASNIADKLSGHYVELDRSNDTARVVLDDSSVFDFAGCVGGTIESDILRRDFTVNALAWSAEQPDSILDLVGGLNDIEPLLIRAVSENAFVDDPLRLLRTYRFSACLNSPVEEQTLDWVKKHSGLIGSVAVERINYELFLLLESPRAFQLLESMGAHGLLEEIFPELRATRQVTANAFHHLGLFEHSLEAVRQLELCLESRVPESNSESIYKEHIPTWVLNSLSQDLSSGVSRLAATKLAALLHDIGKPDTWEITEEGRHTFYGHDTVGAEMGEVLAARMKWSKPISRLIVKLIKWHLRPGQLFHQGEPTDRALNRFYRKVGDDMAELILLSFGDLGATCGDGLTDEARERLRSRFFDLLSGYLQFKEDSVTIPRLMDGKEVMSLLSISPGPIVGELMEALTEAQGIKEVTDRPSAERFVREYYAKKYSS